MIDLIEYFVNWKEYTPEKRKRIVMACICLGLISILSILYLDEIVARIKGEKKEVLSTDVSKIISKEMDSILDKFQEQLPSIKETSEGSFEPPIEVTINDDIDETKCYITISKSTDLQIKPAHMIDEGVIRENIPQKWYQVIKIEPCNECIGHTIFYKIKLDDGMIGYVSSRFVVASIECF